MKHNQPINNKSKTTTYFKKICSMPKIAAQVEEKNNVTKWIPRYIPSSEFNALGFSGV